MKIKRPPPSSITITPLSMHLPSSHSILERRRKRLARDSPARARLFVLHHGGLFYYFCCSGCHRTTPSPIDFSLFGHGGPRRGGTICCAELPKHWESSLQLSGEILLSNLSLISKIRSWMKLLYIHSIYFTPGGVG